MDAELQLEPSVEHRDEDCRLGNGRRWFLPMTGSLARTLERQATAVCSYLLLLQFTQLRLSVGSLP